MGTTTKNNILKSEDILKRIDNKEEFTQDELKHIIDEFYFDASSSEPAIIVKIGERHFYILNHPMFDICQPEEIFCEEIETVEYQYWTIEDILNQASEISYAELDEKEQDIIYRHNCYKKWLLNAIESNRDLKDYELKSLQEFSIDDIEGDIGRWTQSIESIVELCGKYFSLCWERGLTEHQENLFYNQPYEVKKHKYEKTITVTEWVAKEKDDKDEDNECDLSAKI